MDPMTVLRTIWHHKLTFFPILFITLLAASYVFLFGPRSYESEVSYALVNPKLPTEKEINSNPQLATLNSDNPFLRSSDPALITEVLIARLSSTDMSTNLKESGLSTDYNVTRGINGNGFVVSISATAGSQELAYATTKAIGTAFENNLQAIQKINGADDRFLFTAFIVNPSDKATEQFSSRLRSSIMVLLGGVVLMFAGVSFSRSLESMRKRRRSRVAVNESQDAQGDKPSIDDTISPPGVQPSAVRHDFPTRARNRRRPEIPLDDPVH